MSLECIKCVFYSPRQRRKFRSRKKSSLEQENKFMSAQHLVQPIKIAISEKI